MTYTLRKSLQTVSALSATSKQCFEQLQYNIGSLFCTLFVTNVLYPNIYMKIKEKIIKEEVNKSRYLLIIVLI